jgi:hypothetical protein
MDEFHYVFKLLNVRFNYAHNKTNGIFNLSSHNLTDIESTILELGHSFIFQPPHFDGDKTCKQLRRLGLTKPVCNEIVNEVILTDKTKALTTMEYNVLKNLWENPNLVITKADKGDSWVLLDQEAYINECHRQLLDPSTYRTLNNSEIPLISTLLRKVLLSLMRQKFITKSKFEKLVPKLHLIKPRVFYTLPKIHKPTCSWPLSGNVPPGRPIVGNCNSEDTEICKYIDSFLKPIVAKQPFILSNTEHLIKILQETTLSKNSILFSMDVNSLYTNIPIGKGIEIVKKYFDKYPAPRRPDSHILNLLSISLYKNDFLFYGQWYRQTKGVAMGKQYAPSFANLYMCDWESYIMTNLAQNRLSMWVRYLDDIFGIWEGTVRELINFTTSVNEVDENIQVTVNTSATDIQFLDLIIFKNSSSTLSTIVYLKPTSSLKLIHPRSLHPKHVKHGVIHSQILRYHRNTTFHIDFQQQWHSLSQALIQQGYTRSTLRDIKQKAFQHLNHTVNENGQLVKGFTPCQEKCSLCPKYGKSMKNISFEGGGKIISQRLTCSTENIIYVILCNRCQQMYVGETGNTLKQRISQHISSIKLKYPTAISLHFTSNDHSVDDFKFFGLVSNSKWSQTARRLKENYWIKKLKTLTPNGINLELNFCQDKFITIPFKGRHSIPQKLSEVLTETTKVSFTTGKNLNLHFNHKHRIARSVLES